MVFIKRDADYVQLTMQLQFTDRIQCNLITADTQGIFLCIALLLQCC